jgi:hypothetical protein
MKSIYQPMFVLTLALSARPGVANSLTAAGIITNLTQCETQTCGTFPPNLNYNGAFSSFPGTQTVGEGSYVTATGTPLPTLSSQVPTSGASAIISAELLYYIEVVPLNGNTNVAPVQLGVNAVGTTSAETVANTASIIGGGLNDAADFLQLQLSSNSSGTAVFDDFVRIQYVNGTNNQGQCTTSSNTSATSGGGYISAASIGCGGSSVSGGIDETGSYLISSNSVYVVALQANINVSTTNDGNAQGSGSVQASEFIDPAFTAPAGYEVLTSNGIGNTSSVPEPGTSIMLAAGLGLLVVKVPAFRRRSR